MEKGFRFLFRECLDNYQAMKGCEYTPDVMGLDFLWGRLEVGHDRNTQKHHAKIDLMWNSTEAPTGFLEPKNAINGIIISWQDRL